MLKDPVANYAKAVVAGLIIAGPEIRAACKRHLDDLKHAGARGFRFDVGKMQRAIDFFPDVLTVEIDGRVVPFHLLDWQQFVVGSIFGWVYADTGFRRFDRAYIEAGKGSGKTPLLAGIGLYMMLADGELSAECYSAAAKREQAMILFTDVVNMVDRSVRLKRKLVQTGQNPVWQLTHRPTKSKFKPLSADKAKSGARVSCGLVDELHEHKDRYTIDMLEAGFKGRKQPIMCVATNSGFDRNSICWEWHDHALAVVQGLRSDDGLFAFVLSLDEGDDPLEDESCWAKTNPGIDITVTRKYLRSQVNAAREIPGRENGVRRLNFCQWTDAESTWVTRAAWVGCEEPLGFGDVDQGKMIAPAFAGAECYLGLDLSFAFDLTALAVVFPEPIPLLTADGHAMLGPDGEQLYLVDPVSGEVRTRLCAWIEYFTPRETAAEREKRDRVPYLEWIQRGLIHGTPGKIVRKEYMAARIGEITGQFDVRWAAFDRYRHKELAQEMAEEGVDAPWIEHPQGFRRGGQLELRGPDGNKLDNPLWMPDSVQRLEGRILERTLLVQPSPVTRWQVSSTVIRQDPAGTGNRVFDKAKAVGRIDGIVALAMAVGAAEMRLPVRDISGFLAQPVMTRG